MAVEAKRGCGFRKAGGLYIVSEGLSEPCERLPIPVLPCPFCCARIKQIRGFQWLTRDYVLKGAKSCDGRDGHSHRLCVVCTPDVMSQENYGLIWVGGAFYLTMDDWSKEAGTLGISKRVNAIPKGVEIGKTWVLAAHPKGMPNPWYQPKPVEDNGKGAVEEEDDDKFLPAICSAFRVERIELIVTPSMEKERWVKDLVEKDVTLVRVPEDDPDHAPRKSRKSARRRSMDKVAKRMEAEDLFEKDK